MLGVFAAVFGATKTNTVNKKSGHVAALSQQNRAFLIKSQDVFLPTLGQQSWIFLSRCSDFLHLSSWQQNQTFKETSGLFAYVVKATKHMEIFDELLRHFAAVFGAAKPD